MNTKYGTTATLYVAFVMCGVAFGESTSSAPIQSHESNVTNPVAGDIQETSQKADRRFEEMLGKMQAAVEEIAELYGNPVFLQVFTNDADRAAELRSRLKMAQNIDDVRRELDILEKKRDDLQGDIALKERETAKLNEKLLRQRKALDALAAAFEQAKDAVEYTAK
jgi:chromosome segregation ATPase